MESKNVQTLHWKDTFTLLKNNYLLFLKKDSVWHFWNNLFCTLNNEKNFTCYILEVYLFLKAWYNWRQCWLYFRRCTYLTYLNLHVRNWLPKSSLVIQENLSSLPDLQTHSKKVGFYFILFFWDTVSICCPG